MPTQIRIYYEGHADLRSGLSDFFRKLRLCAKELRCRFELIHSGSNATACRDFERALRWHPDAWNFLLIDSEGPFTGITDEFRSRYPKASAHSDSIFWMVQTMEAWFYADKEALETFYGPGFHKPALSKNSNIEEISKADLEAGLSKATRKSKKKDYYDNKTSHGPKLLSLIDPVKVQEASPNCQRIFTTIMSRLDSCSESGIKPIS